MSTFNHYTLPTKPAGFFCTGITADPELCYLINSSPADASCGVNEYGDHKYQYIHAFTGEIMFNKAHTRIIQWPGSYLKYNGQIFLVLYGVAAGAGEPDTFLGAVIAPSKISYLQGQLNKIQSSTSSARAMILTSLKKELQRWMPAHAEPDPYDLSSL
jgi:hypothetical protein